VRIWLCCIVVALLGCVAVVPWEGMKLFHQGKPFPSVWGVETHRLGSSYIIHYHDCDDMANEMADYLHRWFSWDDMRIMYGYRSGPFGGGHAWLEVWWDGNWYVCDPSGDNWMWKFNTAGYDSKDRPTNWSQFQVFRKYPSDPPYVETSPGRESGYLNRGDYFKNGQWYNKNRVKQLGRHDKKYYPNGVPPERFGNIGLPWMPSFFITPMMTEPEPYIEEKE